MMVTRALLRSIRNDLPMSFTIRQLGDKGPYAKSVEGRLRFQCPHCGETLVCVNPRNNLAHCFGCKINLNNIDLLLKLGYDFREAVITLQRMLVLYHEKKSAQKLIFDPPESVERKAASPESIGPVLRRELGNRGVHD